MFELLFKYPRETYARSELFYAGSWPDSLLYVLAAIAVMAISYFLYQRRKTAASLHLLSIAALQFAMLALALWLLRLPSLSTEVLRDGQNSVAVVLDTSGSMAYGADSTRIGDAIAALQTSFGADSDLNVDISFFELSDDARRASSIDNSETTGTQTAFADSLTSVLRQARSDSLAAIVLASDGIDTSGGLSVEQLAEIAGYGIPIHTIPVGRTTMPEDLELGDVIVPDTVMPDSTLSARVTVRHDAGGETRLKIYDGDTLLASETIELLPDGNSTTAWIDFSISDAGPHRLDFTLEGREGEQELRNNTRSRLINVEDQDYRILYFEGEPRWEYKFLRRAVHGDEELQVVSLLRVSPNKFYRQGIASPEQLEDGFPQTREELFAYDALIIGSVEAASLTVDQQQLIRDFVSERGGSLLMLAGPNGLGNGGWGQTSVADALPTQLPSSSADSFSRKKAAVVLTSQGDSSQMLRLADDTDENRLAWTELPEIADYQVLGTLKPAATPLLAMNTNAGTLPLLVTQPFGRGHSYVLATGGTWRWQMSMPVEDMKHETFWRQLLRSLVATAPKNVSLSASSSEGQTNVGFRAEFREDNYAPMENIGVAAVISHEDGATFSTRLDPSVSEPGVYRTSFEPDRSGTWYVEAVAERDGSPVSTARVSVHHEMGQAEHFNIRSNPAFLQRLSEVTGGRSLGSADLNALPDLLRYSSSGITEQEHRSIWDAPVFFLLLLLLKVAEWLLRRRWRTI